jgi:hypothetical protein
MNPVHILTSCFLQIHSNNIFSSTSRSLWLSLYFTFFYECLLCTPFRFNVCYIPCPSHPPWFDHSSNIWRKVQVMNLIIIQPSPASYHIYPLDFKHSPQHPVLRHPSLYVLSLIWETKIHTHQHYRKNYSFVYFKLTVFIQETKWHILDRMLANILKT